VSFRRRLISIVCVGALMCAAVPAAAGAARGIGAARTVLRLTDERLSLMKQVMASKWLSRSPIEDRDQERRVVAGALALSRRHGLADAGIRRIFGQEITAAKEVQLGWGERWLWYGFPLHTTPPDLARLRAQLAAITPKLVDALAGLGPLRCQPSARATLTHATRHLIRITYVTERRRAAIVAALLSVRHVGSSCR
jgi:chorismate mutase